ncbi:hypothetical protein [Streptomyces sp. DSM 41931]|uniref:hypothetical protein n=1 Tax=Streptomyces sp. DSM 41931 TaxID=3418367 RepID=UPI003CFEAE81
MLLVTTATRFRQVRNQLWQHTRKTLSRAGLPGFCDEVAAEEAARPTITHRVTDAVPFLVGDRRRTCSGSGLTVGDRYSAAATAWVARARRCPRASAEPGTGILGVVLRHPVAGAVHAENNFAFLVAHVPQVDEEVLVEIDVALDGGLHGQIEVHGCCLTV